MSRTLPIDARFISQPPMCPNVKVACMFDNNFNETYKQYLISMINASH